MLDDKYLVVLYHLFAVNCYSGTWLRYLFNASIKIRCIILHLVSSHFFFQAITFVTKLSYQKQSVRERERFAESLFYLRIRNQMDCLAEFVNGIKSHQLRCNLWEGIEMDDEIAVGSRQKLSTNNQLHWFATLWNNNFLVQTSLTVRSVRHWDKHFYSAKPIIKPFHRSSTIYYRYIIHSFIHVYSKKKWSNTKQSNNKTLHKTYLIFRVLYISEWNSNKNLAPNDVMRKK